MWCGMRPLLWCWPCSHCWRVSPLPAWLVWPRWSSAGLTIEENDKLLRGAYTSAMKIACNSGVRTIAFALISAGVFSGDRGLRGVLAIAARAIRDSVYPELEQVHMVCFTHRELHTMQQVAVNVFEAGGDGEAAPPAPVAAPVAAPAAAVASPLTKLQRKLELPDLPPSHTGPVVLLRTLSRRELQVPLSSATATVGDVKKYIEEHGGVAVDDQRLLFEHRQLDDKAPAAPVAASNAPVIFVQRVALPVPAAMPAASAASAAAPGPAATAVMDGEDDEDMD